MEQRYAKKDVYAEVDEEGGPINRLVAVAGQVVPEAYSAYVDDADTTTDPTEAKAIEVEFAAKRATSVRTTVGLEAGPSEHDHEHYRDAAAAIPGAPAAGEPESAEVVEINATDGAVTLAQDEGVDLATIEGTGKGGKVTVDDVRDALAAGEPAPEDEDEEQ